MTRTKIICTIGPAVNSMEKMIELIEAGMNVARLNFSHGSHGTHQATIDMLKEARLKVKKPLAIMLDTKGPEIRLRKVKNDQMSVSPGQTLLLVAHQEADDHVVIDPGYILNDLKIGTRILFDDGYISSKVIELTPDGVLVQIENGGILKSGKGVNIPYASLSLPAVTERDIEDIRFGCKNDIDMIAASFVRSADHVIQIKRLLAEEKKSDTMVLAKIENAEGIQNFDSIIQVADGVMIARGDLGVEVPLSQVPGFQKMMIRKCYLAGKPSITATQMLESMIVNPRPTRAEASDVANAVYDSTSAVMLSGETAVGKYPLEVVRVMKSIVDEVEKEFNYEQFFDQHASIIYHDVPSALTLASVQMSYSSHAQAIFAFTSSGSTARLLSRLRPKMPIIAMTDNPKAYHQMALNWGVIPYLGPCCKSITEAFDKISQFCLENKIISNGALVVVTAGAPFGVAGTTNMILVENIGDVLVRAHVGYGEKIHGNIALIYSSESRRPFSVKDQLLVLTRCDESFLPLIQEAAGVILQNHIDDVESERYVLKISKTLSKPAIVRADAAAHVLKEGQLVTLDPEKAVVYKGVVL